VSQGRQFDVELTAFHFSTNPTLPEPVNSHSVLGWYISAIVRSRNAWSEVLITNRHRDGGKMGSKRFLHSLSRVLTTSIAVTILLNAAWAAKVPQVIYSLAGENDGEYTDTDLVIDSAGNLYGTSVQVVILAVALSSSWRLQETAGLTPSSIVSPAARMAENPTKA